MKGGLNIRNALAVLAALFLAAPLLSAGIVRNEESAQKARDHSKYEAWLQKQVRHELLMLPYYSVFDNLEYRIDGDKVILSGQVMRPVLKSDAENAVKKIEGVSKVVNRIEVLPASFNDDRLRRAVYRSIYRNSVLQRYGVGALRSIHIIVNRGNVTLEGVVDNEMDKNVANIQANSVPGVFSVTNHLRVVKS